MHRRISWPILGAFVAALLVFAGISAPTAWGQNGSQGTVTVTVVDQSGGVVSGAQLQLQDLGTNDVRNAVTQDRGNYSFVNLPLGTYKLTVSKTGFATQVYDSVITQAAQVTDVGVTLKVAAANGEKVEVIESATPLVDTTTNAVGTTIDMKQIEDLPLGGRDITQLASLMPGVTTSPNNGPTWNGLPSIAQGNNIDGVISSSSRGKFGGNSQPAVSARIEDIQEMTVQTDQLDPNQGFGTSAMQVNFVTRRGSNSFHGRAYEDFQNSYLNANTWYNDANGGNSNPVFKKGHFELNDFGGSLGGPILKNKLFFFGSFAENKSPGTRFPTATIMDANEQQGKITYQGSDNAFHTVCLFTNAVCPQGLINQYNAANGTNLPTSVSSVIQQQFTEIQKSVASGAVTTPDPTDPDTQTLTWTLPAGSTTYFPTVRVDYNLSQAFRLNFAWDETKVPPQLAGNSYFPGAEFAWQASDFHQKVYTAAFGFDWTLRPTLINQFRGGFLYNDTAGTSSQNFNVAPTLFWAGNWTSPQQYNLGTFQYYPAVNGSDTTTWQHGAHSVSFGFSYYREQDHYGNPPGGIYGIGLGLAGGDPALNAFDLSNLPAGTSNNNQGEIESLYATLSGDISGAGNGTGNFAGNGVDLKTGTYQPVTYNLDELQSGWNLFASDSFRVRPTLTVNYSLLWSFTGDDHDLTGVYHGITSVGDMYGSSGAGNLFMPGVLNGNPVGGTIAAQAHQYKPWKVAPQPQLGVAWNPQFTEGMLGKLTGNGGTVIRAGFGVRRFTEPYQYFWNAAADQAFGFLQDFNIAPGSGSATGTYAPGSLFITPGSKTVGGLPANAIAALPLTSPCGTCGTADPGWSFAPQTYQKSVTEAQFAFLPGQPQLKGFDPNIKQPYSESWNLGFERQIGKNNAIEVRYVGNHVVHQWITMNLNEVNIFQPGDSFLSQFQQAQANLALNKANAGTYPAYAGTFAYNPAVKGEADMPIFDAAFAGETGPLQKQDWGYGRFTNTYLPQGRAGNMASSLTQTSGGQAGADFFCNLVGQGFVGCANIGYTGAGAGYPANYFQANPFYSGKSTFYQTAGGSSNYNGLQVDFRQKQWHGMQFDANYTWSHNLGLNSPDDWQAAFNQLTLRDMHLSYAPTNYDVRQVVHVSGTYDLPIGRGKEFLNHGGVLDKALGGWTVGTIVTFQTGFPFTLGGNGYRTFNNVADGGLVLNGVTRSQLQDAVGVYKVPNATFVDVFNPSTVLASPTGGIATNGNNGLPLAYPNTSAGTLLTPIYLQGPRFWNTDLSITKSVPIRENLRFSLQGEFLNAFNHPNFNYVSGIDSGAADAGFGQLPGYFASGPRAIELRANLEF